ncbi:MAG: hypothetical protein II567_04395 [Candidatus Riflebacteria bacterium]|nr:hypothetical protein [Candidatus Riflebacteria bacterium]
MLYKFFNKKGNITVVLIGLISVMLLMTLALSKRMTGHTQLLTLGDYTQISRYFLESYMSHIMQQVRAQVNDPTSELNNAICNNSDSDLSRLFQSNYKESEELKKLSEKYTPNIIYKKENISVILTEDTNYLKYPKGIGFSREKERKGHLEIKCSCEFNKRKYELKVQYPFSVVFRMTPILKDFMLFVDRINSDQNSEKDYINIFRVGENGYLDKDEQKLRRENPIRKDLRPFVLIQPLDDNYDNSYTSGKVYLGAPGGGFNSFGTSSDYPVYLNLSGGNDYTMNETFLVSVDDLGIDTLSSSNELTEIPMFRDKNLEEVSLPGLYLPMANADQMGMIGIMGFSTKASELFDGSSYKLEDFFPPDKLKGLNPVMLNNEDKNRPLDLAEAMSYSSGLRLMGLRRSDGYIVDREIYGNVLARFMVFSFWQVGSSQGVPLSYDLTKSNSDIPKQIIWSGDEKEFKPANEKSYQTYMSRVMSGIDRAKDDDFNRLSPETKKNYFMALNIDKGSGQHNVFNENNYNDQNEYSESENKKGNGFALKDEYGNTSHFYELGKIWFDSNDNPDPTRYAGIEKRIGRAYKDEESFKKAVGYNDKAGADSKQSFKINGVVYVKGDLDLSKGMILDSDSCSGGVVLVDGNITLGNIYRKEKLDVSRFTTAMGGEAITNFTNWNKADADTYIGPDKILTFVCLKEKDKPSRTIKVTGNVVLGVQLINMLDPEGFEDQVEFTPANRNNGLIFYGAIACNRLNLINRVQEFGNIRIFDTGVNAPFFLYPPVMATKDLPLAVQIMEKMRTYQLTSGVVAGKDETR